MPAREKGTGRFLPKSPAGFLVTVRTKKVDKGWAAIFLAQTRDPAMVVEAGLLDDMSQIAEYGFYNEFGTKDKSGGQRIPERSFIRRAFDDNRPKYNRMMDKILKDAQLRGVSLRGGMIKIATVMTNDIKKRITKLKSPVNADSTIAMKGSSNPLIDDGIMRNAIRWRLSRQKSTTTEIFDAARTGAKVQAITKGR